MTSVGRCTNQVCTSQAKRGTTDVTTSWFYNKDIYIYI